MAISASVATLVLAMRPGALRAAADGFDASLEGARALAAASGNGATMVFAPRLDARGSVLPGFTLQVYRGRPNATGAVTPSTVMVLTSDADVREATLGAPPFAIFLSSAGHPSGKAAYPQFDAHGTASFVPITIQPVCPSGGFTFTFTSTSASDSRALSCKAVAFGTPQPLVTMTPAPIVLTPSSLVYDWPADSRRAFVATEWGYPRWFAATNFSCGGVATFPLSAPAPPYSPPNAAADVDAWPQAPGGVPYAFANAAESMEDAPAQFYLDPASGGMCSATIGDAYGQRSSLAVQVMGQLVASPATVSWSSAADHAVQTVTFEKTFDAQPLALATIGNSCAGIASVGWGAATAPSQPSAVPSSQTMQLLPMLNANGANAGGSCAITVASQYSGEPPATVSINVPGQMRTWPIAVQYAQQGQQLAIVAPRFGDLGSFVNAVLAGGIAAAGGCTARAYTDASFTNVDANDATFASLGVTTDATGCYNGSLVAYEPPGQSGNFIVANSVCGVGLIIGTWDPFDHSGQSATLAMSGGKTVAACSVALDDGTNIAPSYGYGLIAANVISSCEGTGSAIGPNDGKCYTLYYADICESGIVVSGCAKGFFFALQGEDPSIAASNQFGGYDSLGLFVSPPNTPQPSFPWETFPNTPGFDYTYVYPDWTTKAVALSTGLIPTPNPCKNSKLCDQSN